MAERSQQAIEYDAGEKRVTELYVKAAEQLGSDKAPVRLAGLYALERVAQDNPAQRQSISEVICAYLRMPYTPPPRKRANVNHTAQNALDKELSTDGENGEEGEKYARSYEERQVRLAAQRILARHLKAPRIGRAASIYWGEIRLDLTEATLVDADFQGCHLYNVDFRRTEFIGSQSFAKATFHGVARFEEARFVGTTWFGDASFQSAWFDDCQFLGVVRFDNSVFDVHAWFDSARFEGSTDFTRVEFNGSTKFDSATFKGHASFREAVTGENFEGDLPQGWHVDEVRRKIIKDIFSGEDS
ncbi:pentapeptide repeat-containing protein [Micromonospora humida]|uniref:pentapeptide repeat-containing protein n=1 Tax=Micromonospora humida TaxID=2809018 RepID=UPI0033CC7BF9